MMIDQKVREAASVPSPTLGREILWLSAAGWMRRLFGGNDVPLADGAGPVPHLMAEQNPYVLNATVPLNLAAGAPALELIAAMHSTFTCLSAEYGWSVGDVVRFGETSSNVSPINSIWNDASGMNVTTPAAAANLTQIGGVPTPAKWKLSVYGVW